MREYGASTEEIRSEIHSIRLKSREAIRRVLSPEQQKRFDELTASRPPKPAGATPGQVLVLGPEGKPQRVEVRSGITDDSFTEIVQGDLKPGQQVIIGYLSTGKSPGRSK
jgi:HlyD family secretion protein